MRCHRKGLRDVIASHVGERLRLALKLLNCARIVGERPGQCLDRHLAIEPKVGREIHGARAASAEDAVDTQGFAEHIADLDHLN